MILELVALFTIVLWIVWISYKENKDLPPGPVGLPIIGHLPLLGSKPHLTLIEWKKIYGNILYCRFGSFPTVILSDPKLIKQTFNMQETAGRAEIQAFVEATEKKGIAFSESYGNTEQRQFAIRILKDFGMGRKTIEGTIQEDLLDFLDRMGKMNGAPVSNEHLFNKHVINSLWTIVMGDRMESDKLNYLVLLVRDRINNLGSVWGQLAFFMPWMENWAQFLTLGKLSFQRDRIQALREARSFMLEQIRQLKATWAKDQPRHVLDAWLDKMEETKDPQSSFYEPNNYIGQFATDIFLGGVETSSTSLEWLLNYMARYPKVQRKLQEEVDRVTGGNRLPCIDDRPQMPYADAVMYELLRISSIFTLGLHHRAMTDVTVQGYKIPKGAMILANLYGVHHDPEVYGDPENFRPERWLGEQANKLKSDHFLPFSTGKRNCVGEIMARQQLFLYIATIFQRFNVEFEGKPPEMGTVTAVVLLPAPFKVCFRPRQPA